MVRILFLLLVSYGTVGAQFHMNDDNQAHYWSGSYCGYKKVGTAGLGTKHKFWIPTGAGIPAATPNNAYLSDTSSFVQFPNFLPYILLLDNVDSSMKSFWFTIYGAGYLNSSPPRPIHRALIIRKNCDRARYFGPYPQAATASNSLRNRNEYAGDSASTAYATNTNIYPTPLPYTSLVSATTNSLTIFHGMVDLLRDTSLGQQLRNVPAYGGATLLPGLMFQNRQVQNWGVHFSRIYRYKDYATINSPEPCNKQVITAIRGGRMNYNVGFTDTGRGNWDSVRIIAEPLRIRKYTFHPNTASVFVNLTTPSINQAIRTGIRDSTQWCGYYPGFSATQPFGTSGGASFSITPSTGQLSFIASDTGVYLLSFRIQEYRDGQILGDIPYYRLAYVIDTNAALPNLSLPVNVSSNVAYNPGEPSITANPGQTITFQVTTSNTLANSRLVLTTSPLYSTPGATVSYTTQGTDSVTASFSWTPTTADTGQHYFWADVVDTQCTPGHIPMHVSKGLRIKVRSLNSGTVLQTGAGNLAFSVYPVPTSSQLYVAGIREIAAITLTDITGRRVLHQEGNGRTLDVRGIATGAYFIRILDKHGNYYQQKVVVER